jgi:hypothetical protein
MNYPFYNRMNWNRLFTMGLFIFSGLSCAIREKLNPFDPNGHLNLNLDVFSTGQAVELSWDRPNLEGYTGFNIHRRQEGVDSSYKIIAENIPSERRTYTDDYLMYRQRYSYYITVVSEGIESKPSNTVSIVPGPGEVWIVDKWGYQLVHTTYDVEHVIGRYLTNWPPTDCAIAGDLNTGLILYNEYGIIEGIELASLENRQLITSVAHPYGVVYDPGAGGFWVIDSSGYLYQINASTFQLTALSPALGKPVQISISLQAGYINIVDQKLKKIITFDREGNKVSEISTVQGHALLQPERFAVTSNLGRFWLIDDSGEWDRIYTRAASDEDFQCIDSLSAAGDLSLTNDPSLVWIVSLNGTESSIMQLSASGTRQLELKGYYDPYDIEINRYDRTLLVADTGNSRVLHYDTGYQILGMYLNLYFPVKVIVE